VALLSVIRRWHLREGIPIREVARRTGLSRNTVRKYLAGQVIEPAYPPRKTPQQAGRLRGDPHQLVVPGVPSAPQAAAGQQTLLRDGQPLPV